MKWLKTLAVPALIAATALAYLNTLGNDFVWDDQVLVVSNSYIRNWHYFGAAFLTDLFHGNSSWAASHYRPLQTLSYTLDYQCWGLNPAGYHLTNLVLHLACVLLIYAMLRRFFRSVGLAFATALLFGVHAINTNAITYIAGRADPLTFAWLLGAILLLDRYRCAPRPTGVPALGAYTGSVLCYTAALFSRENALLLPVLVLFYCLVVRPAPSRKWREALATAVPFVLLAAAFSVMRHAALIMEGRVATSPWAVPLLLRLQIPFRALATYLALFVWPAHLQMERQVVFGSPWLPVLTTVGALTFLGLLSLGWWARRRSAAVLFGVGWFLLTVIPMLGVLDLNSTVAEHWVYVPSVGFYLAVLGTYAEIEKRVSFLQARRPWLTVRFVFGLAVVALAVRTALRNTVWATETKFYAATTKAAPYSAAARVNFGRHLVGQGDDDLAFRELLTAERMAPNYPSAKLKLAGAYLIKGDLPQAAEKIEQCLKLDPGNTSALLLAADISERQGRRYLAQQYFIEAISTTTGPVPAMRYAEFLIRQHKLTTARTIVRQALAYEPGSAPLHNLLGIILAEAGDEPGAARAFHEAQALDRFSPDAWVNLARLAARHGETATAAKLFERALERAPDDLPALYQAALIHCQLGQHDRAQEELRHAQSLAPRNAQVRAAWEALQRAAPCPELGSLTPPHRPQLP